MRSSITARPYCNKINVVSIQYYGIQSLKISNDNNKKIRSVIILYDKNN